MRDRSLFSLLPLAAALLIAACGAAVDHTRHGSIDVHTIEIDYANLFVVRAGAHTVLIDAGLERNGAGYVEALRTLGVTRADALVVTHGHGDHAGGVQAVRAATGARVVAARADEPLFARGFSEALCPTGFIARSRVEDDLAERFTPYAADVWIDGPTDLAAVSGVPGQIVPVPGHTPGSVAVVVGEALFVGDLLRGAIVGSSAEVHFYMCDLAGNRETIARLLAEHPQVTTCYPGHFGPIERAEVEALLARWPETLNIEPVKRATD